MNGKKLIEKIAAATGLPMSPVQSHLHTVLEAAGANVDHLTLDQVRGILAEYMQNVLLDAKAEFDAEVEAPEVAKIPIEI